MYRQLKLRRDRETPGELTHLSSWDLEPANLEALEATLLYFPFAK